MMVALMIRVKVFVLTGGCSGWVVVSRIFPSGSEVEAEASERGGCAG